jgi:hypothetical protein
MELTAQVALPVKPLEDNTAEAEKDFQDLAQLQSVLVGSGLGDVAF